MPEQQAEAELAIAFVHDRHRHLHEVIRPALAAGQTQALLQENVRLKYLQLARSFGHPVVDGSWSPEATLQQAMRIVRPHLARLHRAWARTT